jgi:RNA polymerase sigma factor (sigma-70 family)
VQPRSADLLALDAALEQLGTLDPRLEQVVECRFFGGLSAGETAQALDVSLRTVERDWTRARAYLHELLEEVS